MTFSSLFQTCSLKVNSPFSNNPAMRLQNSEIVSVEQNKKTWFPLKAQEPAEKNICFKELGKFSFLTLLSVARHSDSDHFQELSTEELTRICFEGLTGPMQGATCQGQELYDLKHLCDTRELPVFPKVPAHSSS